MSTSTNNALAVIVKALGIAITDEIIPSRGEAFECQTTGLTHFWIRRSGFDGEIHVQIKVEKNKAYTPVCGIAAKECQK